MDPSTGASSMLPKPATSLPRMSKLPAARPRTSQIPGIPTPVRSGIPPPTAKVPTPSATVTPRLQKRASIASISQTRTVTAPKPKPRPIPAPATTITTTKNVPQKPTLRQPSLNSQTLRRPTSLARPSGIRPLSRIGQPGIIPASAKTARPVNDAEDLDHLGAMTSFRSSSRQSAYDESDSYDYDDTSSMVSTARSRTSSRPSLSDRTIESLHSLPSTPKDRRRSSFFSNLDSPTSTMPPPLRPLSSLSRNDSSSSRPGTSDGGPSRSVPRLMSPAKRIPSSARPATRTSLAGLSFGSSSGLGFGVGGRRTISMASSTGSQIGREPSPPSPSTPVDEAISPVMDEVVGEQPDVEPEEPTVNPVASPPMTHPIQPLVLDLEALRSADAKIPNEDSKTPRPLPAVNSVSGPSKTTIPLQDGEVTPRPSVTSEPTKKSTKATKQSSSALREQIAAAKAAARKDKEKIKHDSFEPVSASSMASADFGSHDDPFNQGPKDGKHILQTRINRARSDGKLNIAALELDEFPDEVMTMYDASALESSKTNWAEVVDVTKLIAADNNFKHLSDDVFPDRSMQELLDDPDGKGNQFGGLELIDLHGNMLQAIPRGLRHLEHLTSLNLARNKLDNSALDIIGEVKSLRDLQLGQNHFSGNLPTSFCQLTKLERLELQENRLLGLPEAMREMVNLRVLNVAGNQLTALPMEALQLLPLTELDASNNALIASLFPLGSISSHDTLQNLRVANNSLAALAFSEMLNLPELRTLDVSNNHLTILPPVTGWPELHTLTAGDNKLTEFPAGFTSLRKLRHANFASNELRLLDPDIGRMDSLETLILAANPLREKKFLNMSAADIRRDLKSRLDPDDVSVDSRDDEVWADAVEHGSRPSTASGEPGWALKGNGVLDLAGRNLANEVDDSLGTFLRSREVKSLLLQGNQLNAIPLALGFAASLTSLDLSNNPFESDYLTENMFMPVLQELNLARCRLSSSDMLQQRFIAPKLQVIDLTANRLTGSLPEFRELWPELRTLLASDNRYTSITAASLRGLQTINLKSNDIEQLPAEVGLLWDEGLRNLEVGSNVFRMPNYRILEKGTEATLRWLRDRLPATTGT